MLAPDKSVAAESAPVPQMTPISTGPVDLSAPWRKSYEAFAKEIRIEKDEHGEFQFKWGDAADFGAWYERCRYIAPEMYRAMQHVSNRRQILAALKPIEDERDQAAKRLAGVEWTAIARNISRTPSANSRLDLPPLPDPLRLSFWVEKGDVQAWSQVQKGDRVRFACRFEVSTMGANPSVDVHMRLVEVVKP